MVELKYAKAIFNLTKKNNKINNYIECFNAILKDDVNIVLSFEGKKHN